MVRGQEGCSEGHSSALQSFQSPAKTNPFPAWFNSAAGGETPERRPLCTQLFLLQSKARSVQRLEADGALHRIAACPTEPARLKRAGQQPSRRRRVPCAPCPAPARCSLACPLKSGRGADAEKGPGPGAAFRQEGATEGWEGKLNGFRDAEEAARSGGRKEKWRLQRSAPAQPRVALGSGSVIT